MLDESKNRVDSFLVILRATGSSVVSLRGLMKIQTEIGIGYGHNLLKVAGVHQLLSIKNKKPIKRI